MTQDAVQAELKLYVLSIIVHNEPGALARIVTRLSGRGYNIDSLAVAGVNSEVSRITVVCRAPASDRLAIDQIMTQINALIPVRRVRDLTDDEERVDRELTILRVDVSGKKQEEARSIAIRFGARECKSTPRCIFFIHDVPDIDIFQEMAGALGELGNVAVARRGLVSLGGRTTIREVR